MKNQFYVCIGLLVLLLASCTKEISKNFVKVEGGTFKNIYSNLYAKGKEIKTFYMATTEVTQKEWNSCMSNNPSVLAGDNLPVTNVSWYDCIEYCNKRSEKEGLEPFYILDKNKKDKTNTSKLDSLKWLVTTNEKATGYRLPTKLEWEYAATGGQLSKSYKYSGSDDVNQAAWNWKNSGKKMLSGDWNWTKIESNKGCTKAVATKLANELGIFDMSGNVREWCFDSNLGNKNQEEYGRVWKGGGWIGAEFCCDPNFSASYEPNGKAPDQGFRVCRNF